jgi:hypothetical protein
MQSTQTTLGFIFTNETILKITTTNGIKFHAIDIIS